jgi:NAD-dependent deacetylase
MLSEMDEMILRAVPNPAHFALAEMEKKGLLSLVITQNVDSLHQRAGSEKVIEYHGHTRSLRCEHCAKKYYRSEISMDILPPFCDCGYALRPEIVFFGEEISDNALVSAYSAACDCDLMLIIGTSATVAPASYLPHRAKERGAFLVEINPLKTKMTNRLTDLYISERAGRALPAILAAIDDGNKKWM